MNILLRAGKDYFQNLSPEVTFSFRRRGTFGHNLGFYIMSDSVYKIISTPNTKITPDSYLLASLESYKKNVAETINKEFDQLVLPMADLFKLERTDYLKRFTELIKSIEIPTCMFGCGIGVNTKINNLSHEFNNIVYEFISAVLDKSKSIGVRGNITFDYLNSLGFNKNEIKVLGCPSVYYNGPNYNITSPEINNDSKIALNITPYVNQMTPIVNTISNEFNNYEYFMQDIRDLNLMLYGKEWGPGVQKVRDYYPKILNENKAAFPIDSRSWINNLKNFDYSIGSRLHGTIAALNAGIPGTLIVHDLRTEEIAQYHKMPYVKIEDVYKSIDVKQIAQNSDWDAFNKTSKANYKKLINFLKENKIEVYSKYPNPTIIEKEKNMKIPPLVRSIYSNNRIDQKSLLSRLQYLEEKNCYTPPFKVVNSTKKRILIEKLKNIIKKI